MRTEQQKELDRVEEYILNKLFGDIENPRLNENIKLAMKFMGIDFDEFINEKINIFESCAKNFVREDGFLDVEKIEQMIYIKHPELSGLKLPVARPIEYIKLIDLLIHCR